MFLQSKGSSRKDREVQYEQEHLAKPPACSKRSGNAMLILKEKR